MLCPCDYHQDTLGRERWTQEPKGVPHQETIVIQCDVASGAPVQVESLYLRASQAEKQTWNKEK